MAIHDDRLTAFEAIDPKFCCAAILRFVRGVRAPRKEPVNLKQILDWLRGTDPDFVDAAVTALLVEGKLEIRRTSTKTRGHRRGYVYLIPED